MDHEVVPPEMRQVVGGALATIFLCWIGRMSWHIRQVQKRQRRFWSWHLVWEVPTAVAISFVAGGVVEYLDFHGKMAQGVVIIVSYLGPGGIEAIIHRIADRVSVTGK